MLRTALLAGALVALCHADCVIDHASQDNIWERKLHGDIKKNYDMSEPPVYNNTIVVDSFFVIESYQLDSYEEQFTMTGLILLNWLDGRLCWDTAQYGGLAETDMHSVTLWLPRLRQFHATSADDDDLPFYTTCVVNATGTVECKLKVVFKSKCPMDLRNWPLDVQHCQLEFGSWKHDKAQVRFKFPKSLYYMEVSIETHWVVTDLDYHEYNSSELQTRLLYHVQREAGSLVAMLVWPAIVLAMLSLACYLVHVTSWLRLYLCMFSLFCHYTCLSQLLLYMPMHGDNPPRLMFFYRGSFIITILLFLLNFMLRRMASNVGMVPQWMSTVNDLALRGRWGLLVWPYWEPRSQDVCSKEWMKFTNLTNSASLVVTLIVYISLLVAYIPR